MVLCGGPEIVPGHRWGMFFDPPDPYLASLNDFRFWSKNRFLHILGRRKNMKNRTFQIFDFSNLYTTFLIEVGASVSNHRCHTSVRTSFVRIKLFFSWNDPPSILDPKMCQPASSKKCKKWGFWRYFTGMPKFQQPPKICFWVGWVYHRSQTSG